MGWWVHTQLSKKKGTFVRFFYQIKNHIQETNKPNQQVYLFYELYKRCQLRIARHGLSVSRAKAKSITFPLAWFLSADILDVRILFGRRFLSSVNADRRFPAVSERWDARPKPLLLQTRVLSRKDVRIQGNWKPIAVPKKRNRQQALNWRMQRQESLGKVGVVIFPRNY